MNSKHYIIPIFVPHKGCPHDCVFCNQKKITGQADETNADSVREKIKEYLDTIKTDASSIEVAFYGGSFTAIPIIQQTELLEAAYIFKKQGLINNIRISTRPDCIDDGILSNLKRFGVTIIELGVQSMDEEVLRLSRRGHSREAVISAAELIKRYGMTLGLQMMVGLPGDSKSKSLSTARELIALKPELVRIYPALVIKNTDMEAMYLREEYVPLSLDKAVDTCKQLVILFEKEGIQVIRVGLQPTENIVPGKDVVAGPFHPAMRQLVDAAIYRDMVEYLVDKLGLKGKKMEIAVHPKDVSELLGQQKSNMEYFKKCFKTKDIEIIQGKNMERYSILVKSVENQRKMSKKDYYIMADI